MSDYLTVHLLPLPTKIKEELIPQKPPTLPQQNTEKFKKSPVDSPRLQEENANPPTMAPEVSPLEKPATVSDRAAVLSNAEDMLSNAKRDIGKIDRDLRKAFPRFPEREPNSIQSTLEKGIAAAVAKRGWLGAATMEEITIGSTDGKRIYKISTAGGTYCVTYDGNASGGIDRMQKGVEPKVTSCPN